MDALDLDDDGDISADELTAAATSLKTLDANNDGVLSADELAPDDAKADDDRKSRRRPHVPPVMKVLDADENGEISTEEMAGAPTSLKVLDKNEDGVLSKMETRPNRRIKT